MAEGIALVDPLALQEFELQIDPRVEADKQHAALVAVVLSIVFCRVIARTVWDAASDDAMAIDLVEVLAVARVRAAYMGGERTFVAVLVRLVRELLRGVADRARR